MAPAEQFSLRWNNFYSNLTCGFHELFEEHDMVDVTLAVEGHFLQAHKIVLSICSPFFKQLFKINPCKHPIVILNNITFENLKNILEFIYLGEVNVLRDNLASFLRTAQLLQVKGLTGDDTINTSTKDYNKTEVTINNQLEDSTKFSSSTKDETRSHPKRSNSSVDKVSMKKAKQKLIISDQSVVTNIQNHLNVIDLNNDKINDCIEGSNELSISVGDEEHFIFNNNNKNSVDDALDFIIPNSLRSQDNNDGNGKNAVLSSRNNKHPFQCTNCTKRFSRRDHLRTHEKNIHGEDAGPFTCVICSQLYKNSESLRKHIAKFHYPKIIDGQQKIIP